MPKNILSYKKKSKYYPGENKIIFFHFAGWFIPTQSGVIKAPHYSF